MRTPVLGVVLAFLVLPGSYGQDAGKIPVPRRPNLRVVDYGSDMGGGIYRDHSARRLPDITVDLDGDGQTADDSVSGWVFSLETPLSPSGDVYNTQAPSNRYYGGLVGYHANNPQAALTEGMLNENHELRDDCNFMSNQGSVARTAGNFVQGYATWLWRKEDFINGAHKRRVTFDDESLMAVHVSRYWDDVDGGRWVVRDGDTLYISEQQFGTEEEIARRGKKTRLTWALHPTKTRWARYTPSAPVDIKFDETKAEFAGREFQDVTTVGFYIEKDSLTEGVIAVKWYAFETYAVVDMPIDADIHLETIKRDDGVVGAAEPVSYALWQQVYQWAVSNQFCEGLEQRGYVFDADGDMGDMATAGSVADPVTGISGLDAMAWCNALSELEGREPCYYADAEFNQVFRVVRDREHPSRYDWRPDVHTKGDADGWRVRDLNDGLTLVRGAGPSAPTPDYELDVPAVAPPAGTMGDEAFAAVVDGTYERSDEATVTVTDFEMSKTEVTCADWGRVCDWAEGRGYRFDNDGDMGSMDWWPEDANRLRGVDTFTVPETVHSPNEPVTDVGWWDCVVWCNALSELHGREPVYYEDEEFTKPIRAALPWRLRMTAGLAIQRDWVADVPVHTKWHADGYRLPTWAEWNIAFRAGETRLLVHGGPGPFAERIEKAGWTAANSGGRTHAVSELPANAYGIYDLEGNVSEWLHDTPTNDYYRAHDPKGSSVNSLFGVAYAGGNFRSDAFGVGRRPPQNRKSAGWPWLGFRVVRCQKGAHSTEPFVPKIVLDLKEDDYDPLQGRAFRGNIARTGWMEGDGLPTLKGLKWRFKTGGPVLSSPVVVDGVAYVGSSDGKFYAIEVADGSEKWSFEVGGKVTGSTVVDRDGILYIGSEAGWLYALDAATGEQKWRYSRTPRRPTQSPVTTSPAYAHGIVFVAFGRWDGHYSGIDPLSGQEVWRLRANTPNPGLLGPSIRGTRFWAPVGDNVMVQVDLRTELVVHKYPSHHCLASVPVGEDVFLYSAGPGCVAFEVDQPNRLMNVHVQGGGLGFFPQSGPALHDGMAWFAKGDLQLHAFKVNAERAEPAWKAPLPGNVRSSITVSGPCIYYGCDDGHVFALDKLTGVERWRYKTGGAVASTPWVADGALYVGSEDGYVYALE